MPFRPLPETGPEKPQSPDLALLMIRFVAVVSFFYYQFIEQIRLAVQFVWNKVDWGLVDQVADKGLPFPGVISVAAVLVMAASLLGVALGIFSRINGLILTVLTGIILIVPIDLSTRLSPQSLVLYLAIFLGIALGSAGRLSLDYQLAGRKAKKKGAH